MKKNILACLIIVILSGFTVTRGWNEEDNGYYMGPGMMWGGYYNNGYNNSGYYPGMMGCWGDDDWNNDTKSSLNLTTEQSNRWDNARSTGLINQQAVNDSISYYARQVHRLQQNKSAYVQQDMSYIKQILSPEQYTQFLERLINLDSGR